MESSPDSVTVAEYVDRICTLQVRPVLQGITLGLYGAARKKQGRPLAYEAAQRLVGSVKKGDKVIILSGNGHPSNLPAGETDGPTGVAALARSLFLFGAVPIIVSEREYLPPILEPCKVAGLPLDGKSSAFEEFPLNEAEASAAAERILQVYHQCPDCYREIGPELQRLQAQPKGR